MDKNQCVVFIEQLGEKRLVSYENLTPLPPDQFKPWTIPYRFQRQMHKYSSIRFTRHFNNRFKFNGGGNHQYPFCTAAIESETCGSDYCINDDDPKHQLRHHHHHEHFSSNIASFYKLKQYTQLDNFHHTRTVEYCTMPLTVEHTHSGKAICAAKESTNNTHEQALTHYSSNDNSNAPSRTPSAGGHHNALMDNIAATIKTEPSSEHINDIGQEHLTTNNAAHMLEPYEFDPHNMGGTLYVPESQGYYAMYPYAAPMPAEDYYGGYCMDAAPYHAASAAYMPTMNGTSAAPLYYVCNGPPPSLATNGSFPASNAFMNVPPPSAQNYGLQTVTPQLLNPNGTSSYYSQYPMNPPSTPSLTSNNCQQISETTTTTTAVSVSSGGGGGGASSGRHTPSNRYSRGAQNSSQVTPLSCRRINFDAKRSNKANGVDLPTDIVTLRYFYNLGLEYYHKHLKRAGGDNERKYRSI